MVKIDLKSAVKYSVALHIVIVAIFFVQFPHFGKEPHHEIVIAVDILARAPETNLKNIKDSSAGRPKKSQEVLQDKKQKQDFVPLKASKVKVTKEVEQKAQSKANSVTKDKQKKKADDIDSLLKDLEGGVGLGKKSLDNKKNDRNLSNKAYDSASPLSISDRDSIKMQIEKRFVNPIAIDFKPGELVVKLRLSMNKDRTIKDVIVLNSSVYPRKYSGVFETLKNSLIRAAYIASPIENLPLDKYHGSEGWEEIELSFDAYFLMNSGHN